MDVSLNRCLHAAPVLAQPQARFKTDYKAIQFGSHYDSLNPDTYSEKALSPPDLEPTIFARIINRLRKKGHEIRVSKLNKGQQYTGGIKDIPRKKIIMTQVIFKVGDNLRDAIYAAIDENGHVVRLHRVKKNQRAVVQNFKLNPTDNPQVARRLIGVADAFLRETLAPPWLVQQAKKKLYNISQRLLHPFHPSRAATST